MGLVLARGGSKRVPKKNIKDLCGKPLIAYSIEAGKQSKYMDRVITSTDSEEIAEVARTYGSEVPFMRPAELAVDTATDYPTFVHALEWLKEHENYVPDIVVQLRPTSPLRTAAQIDAAVELLAAHPEADSVRTVTEPDQSPYKMYRVNNAGYLEPLLIVDNDPESFNWPGQKLPKAYKHLGYLDVMWYRTLMEKKKMTGSVIVPLIIESGVRGINSPEDFEYLEFLMRKQNGTGA